MPFISARKWSALAFDESGLRGAYVLGAAEMLCERMPLTDEAQRQIDTWSNEGLRVLVFGRNPDVTSLHDADGEPSLPRLALVGIVCFADELRPHLPETLDAFRRNHVEIKIISGDIARWTSASARR